MPKGLEKSTDLPLPSGMASELCASIVSSESLWKPKFELIRAVNGLAIRQCEGDALITWRGTFPKRYCSLYSHIRVSILLSGIFESRISHELFDIWWKGDWYDLLFVQPTTATANPHPSRSSRQASVQIHPLIELRRCSFDPRMEKNDVVRMPFSLANAISSFFAAIGEPRCGYKILEYSPHTE